MEVSIFTKWIYLEHMEFPASLDILASQEHLVLVG